MARFVEVPRGSLYESVASALEDAILNGDVKQGEKLPSEQSLALQFGVSRNILREALKAVKARGLIDVRNGDGTYIARPDSADLGDMLGRILILSDSAINDYYEIRLALEVKACELASLRATQSDVDALQAIIDGMGKSIALREELARLDYEFHLAVAKATRNPLFPCFLEPLRQLMTDMFHFAYPNSEGRNEAFECHIRILQAIREKSPEGAREAMSYHLERSEINITHLARQSPRLDQSGRDEQGSRGRAARSRNAR